jgi:hypothetical protein
MRALFCLGFAVTIACTPPPAPPPAPAWHPGVVYPTDAAPVRGFVDVRGLVHSHSVYSHDACDGRPVLEDGTRDPACFDDFRRGLCQAKHDFAFLTDHRDAFDSTEFPEALLFRPERGDELIERNGTPTANRISCDDGRTALIMAGNEGGMMPVGLEGHAAARADRGDLYGRHDAEAAQQLRDHGAVVLLAHPEDFSVPELIASPVDGFEMYNLHANTLLRLGNALDLVLRWNEGDRGIPHPDVLLLSIWSEDRRYLQRWGNVLAAGKRVVSTMGTDCHQNTIKATLEDGERGDSYRRMMIMFSNHVRVRPNADGTVDDASVKEALRLGRNWGAFEIHGYPVGFDAFAEKDGATFEIGEEPPLGATMTVMKPRVQDLDPEREPPQVRMRILRAIEGAGGFEVVAEGSEASLRAPLNDAGAYRAEVRILPLHLREDMRDDAFALLDDVGSDYVWIYTGAFYVR